MCLNSAVYVQLDMRVMATYPANPTQRVYSLPIHQSLKITCMMMQIDCSVWPRSYSHTPAYPAQVHDKTPSTDVQQQQQDKRHPAAGTTELINYAHNAICQHLKSISQGTLHVRCHIACCSHCCKVHNHALLPSFKIAVCCSGFLYAAQARNAM